MVYQRELLLEVLSDYGTYGTNFAGAKRELKILVHV